MKKSKIVIKATDYQYPSLKERKEVIENYPDLLSFGFEYKNGFESLINDKLPPDEAVKKENLYWWDNCLINRLGELKETYIYTLTNYNRGFYDDYSICKKNEILNHLQFDYYAEIFYYYFFSTRDIIAQILRIYFKIDIKENKLHINKNFINKIDSKNVKTLLSNFNKDTKDARYFRNGFTHRFTPTKLDYRIELTEINSKKRIGFGSGSFTKSIDIVENINKSLSFLSVFISNLKKILLNK